MFKKLMTIILVNLFLTHAYAEGVIHALKTDSRAKVVAYNPNQIYHLRTHYLVSTDIIFGKDEVVSDYHLGDASSWDIEVSKNHLYIKAKKLDAGGNLNVSTNQYTYHFILSVSGAALNSDAQTLFLQFTYPNHDENERKLALQLVNVPSDICQDKDKHKYNLQYSFTGDREQAPIRACDDGLFTYMKFRKQIDLPAVFMVLPDRREEVVNYRMENGYLVIERVAKAFTLRSGKTVTSVYNDKYICDWSRVKVRSES